MGDIPLHDINPVPEQVRLASIDSSRISTALDLDRQDGNPPEYSESGPPPAYMPKSQYKQPPKYHRLALRLIGFDLKSPTLMLLVCGSYFARWCADTAVAIYVLVNGMASYYDMSPFTLLLSLPMMGIRGFYPLLFPCYNEQAATDACNDAYLSIGTETIVSIPAIFVIVLIPQLLIGIVILADTFQIIQMDVPAVADVEAVFEGVV
ncbi:hypothetical protein HDU91_007201 [Kappamyces sp. JEL0680]|nr:hypothetical protein HDU91_007201 [Kappamyces sp. JEL0680]